jgi:hypothetical protein
VTRGLVRVFGAEAHVQKPMFSSSARPDALDLGQFQALCAALPSQLTDTNAEFLFQQHRQKGGGGLSEAQLLEMMRLVADDATDDDAGDEVH